MYVHARSFCLGALLTLVPVAVTAHAGTFDLGGLAGSVKSLVDLKHNLDGDVSSLTANAKDLITDKDKLKQIKDELLKLANDTKTQVDQIQSLVGIVESHIKSTQGNITNTSGHVHQLDTIRHDLGGK